MLENLEDDGLLTPEVKHWAIQKYGLIHDYSEIFSTSMKNKWERVYVDLYAGPGRSKLKDTGEIVSASPLIALGVKYPFDKYIFCEKNRKKIEHLEIRVKRDFPNANVEYVKGDANLLIDQINRLIPSRGRILTLCVVDPYSIDSMKFNTLKILQSYHRIDFIVLLATFMDANLNQRRLYEDQKDKKVECFLGDPEWRHKWEKVESEGHSFGYFIARSFGKQMESLDYKENITNSVLVYDKIHNNKLYHLALFSKHVLGKKFWDIAKKRNDPQLSIFD